MTQRLAAIAACGVFVLGAAACAGGGGSSRGTHGNSKKIAAAGAGPEQPQAARLVLSAGRSSARYRITAPSPAQYGFDVAVDAPAPANVSVNAHTWYGATLGILVSTRDSEWCIRRGSQVTCFERFPLLPAQRAGTWTVIASKRSGPAATVRVTVAFVKL